MSASHTPGPWRMGRPDSLSSFVATGKCVYSGPKSKPVMIGMAIVSDDDDVADEDEMFANAALIAAAPDLLALAHAFAEECGDCAGTRICPDNEPCDACEDIWDIIDRAEGRA